MLEAQHQVEQSGVGLAICGGDVFQIIECPENGCHGRRVIRSSIKDPALDMRHTIISPTPDSGTNSIEQAWFLRNKDRCHPYLQFQTIPAWDSESLTREDFLTRFLETNEYPYYNFHPIFMRLETLDEGLESERSGGTIRFRRFLPNKYRNLLTCLAPNKIRDFEDDGVSCADGYCHDDLVNRPKAWRAMLQEITGNEFVTAAAEKLTSKGIELPDNSHIDKLLDAEFSNFKPDPKDELSDIMQQIDFKKDLNTFCEKKFKSVLYPVCTELALTSKRKKLMSWTEKVKNGEALFVDAPMGLGKTHSIVEALASNSDLSAVIFMPTNRLCQEITDKLKLRIAEGLGHDYQTIGSHREMVLDDDGNSVEDAHGFYQFRFRREYLQNEVYFADGINEVECPHFNQIVNRYQYRFYSKSSICEKCIKYKPVTATSESGIGCRFLKHRVLAPRSRIVVTTHQQYINFSEWNGIREWNKNVPQPDGTEEIIKVQKLPRDFFIIDEDFLFSHCYEPICQKNNQLRPFVGTVIEFITKLDHPDSETIVASIEKILSKYALCGKTSVVSPIDPDFRIPNRIKSDWEVALSEGRIEVPEFLGASEPVGNLLDIIEKAISKGFTVQNYVSSYSDNSQEQKKRIKRAFFSNPTEYDLTKLPPHIFFDGTMLDEKFIRNKLKGVEISKFKIEVEPLWDLNVWQNVWTDLPKYKIKEDQAKVEQFLQDLIFQKGPSSKYLIVTKKDIEQDYLEKFIKETFPELKYIIYHYGYLRGVNDAKDCDVGIMLGSFAPPDVVEIAMALDFIQEELPPNTITVTKGADKLWTYGDFNFKRIYTDNFAVVGEISDAYKHSEHRQAIARTRYLFHDVDFYVLSKDPVNAYEPYLPEAKTLDFRDDLWVKKERFDNRYNEFKEAVQELLAANGKVTRKTVLDAIGGSPVTARKHLQQMVKNGVLYKPNPKGHSYLPMHEDEVEMERFN